MGSVKDAIEIQNVLDCIRLNSMCSCHSDVVISMLPFALMHTHQG